MWTGFSLYPCYNPFSVSVVFNFTIIKDYFRLCSYAHPLGYSAERHWFNPRSTKMFLLVLFTFTYWFLSLLICLLIIRTSYWPMETGGIRNERLATSQNKDFTPWNSMCFKPLLKLNRHFKVWRASWFEIYFTHEFLVVDRDEKRIQVLAISF